MLSALCLGVTMKVRRVSSEQMCRVSNWEFEEDDVRSPRAVSSTFTKVSWAIRGIQRTICGFGSQGPNVDSKRALVIVFHEMVTKQMIWFMTSGNIKYENGRTRFEGRMVTWMVAMVPILWAANDPAIPWESDVTARVWRHRFGETWRKGEGNSRRKPTFSKLHPTINWHRKPINPTEPPRHNHNFHLFLVSILGKVEPVQRAPRTLWRLF